MCVYVRVCVFVCMYKYNIYIHMLGGGEPAAVVCVYMCVYMCVRVFKGIEQLVPVCMCVCVCVASAEHLRWSWVLEIRRHARMHPASTSCEAPTCSRFRLGPAKQRRLAGQCLCMDLKTHETQGLQERQEAPTYIRFRLVPATCSAPSTSVPI
jgi:hypothetical protein